MATKKPLPPTEDQEQMAVVEFLKIMGWQFTHISNETYSPSWSVKVRAKKLGVSPGFPDLVVMIPTGWEQQPLQMAGIEMKRVRGSKISPEQLAWGELFRQAGIPWKVCKGAADAIGWLKQLHAELHGRDTITTTISPTPKEG